jgi:oxalate decarboxylase/phosphoglucose isomerase-like protein (cupin superfamily)
MVDRADEEGRRPGDMRFVAPDDVETQVFDWGTIKWLAEPRVSNSQRFSQGVVLLLPGKGHTRHNHPDVEETLYIVAGRGRQMVEDPQGRPVYRDVAAGDMVHIPSSIYHETINTGWEPMKIIATYAPHGPEAYLRSVPEVQILPPGELPK